MPDFTDADFAFVSKVFELLDSFELVLFFAEAHFDSDIFAFHLHLNV